MSDMSGKSSPIGESSPFVIDRGDLGNIRDIALQLFHGWSGHFYEPRLREEFLFTALKIFLERKGVTCDWRVDGDF